MPGDEEEQVLDLSNDAVCTKYTTCAEVLNGVLLQVIEKCVAGADIAEICAFGDGLIETEVGKLYNKPVKGERLKKGVAFPTCISPNNLCGHVSPLLSESFKLNAGDLVKIDMGAHIDGFVTQVAHTIVLPGCDDKDVKSRQADVMHAAWNVAELALRTIQVGKKNTDVTEIMNRAVGDFECNMVQGVLSHQCKQHVIDGSHAIIAKDTPEDKMEEFEFGTNEVYCMDVLVSTGEGKPKESEKRTTIFKRDHEMNQQMRTNSAREVLHEVSVKFPSMPFTVRALEVGETKSRAGISEISKAGLCDPYPVLKEANDQLVAQFKFTVLLLPSGTKKITGLGVCQVTEQLDQIPSQKSVKDEELVALLKTSANPKKKKNKK